MWICFQRLIPKEWVEKRSLQLGSKLWMGWEMKQISIFDIASNLVGGSLMKDLKNNKEPNDIEELFMYMYVSIYIWI